MSRSGLGALKVLAGAVLASACARETYDVADLQIDVEAPLPTDAETLHICVSGVGELEQGAGNGRAAFPGLRAGEAVDVSVDVFDEGGTLLASAGPIRLDDATPYVATPLLDPAVPCVANGGVAAEGTDSWLLALRFLEAT